MELEKCCKEFSAKKGQLVSLQESLQSHCKELEVKEKEVEDVKSCDFEIEMKQKELAVKRNQLSEVDRLIKDRLGELKTEDLKLLSVRENLRSVANELSVKKEHLDLVKKEVKVREKEAETAKTCARSCHEEFELKQKGLATIKGLISDCNDELESKQKQFEKLQVLISVCSNELDLKEEKLSVTENSIRQCQNELDLKKNELDATRQILQECLKELNWKQKQLTEVKEKIEESSVVLCSKEKHLDLVKDLIDEFPHNVLAEKVESVKNKYVKLCKEAELKHNQGFSVTIDGKALQIYLNEHSRELDSMRIVVSMALSHSSDPSMLVLDALQGFYPPHLKKGDNMEFEGEIVRKSCSLLLDELIKLSPEIRPHVKGEAERIAIDWLRKLTANAEHSLEVLCFLQLLACYGLASCIVDADKLLTLLEIVKNHSMAPALYQSLGFANKVSHVIRNFIQEKKLNEAIRYIYAFEMVGQFQPVALLNDFLSTSKIATKKLRKKNRTHEGQINASNKRLADIKYALRCIEECKIDYGPSRNNLELNVRSLEKEISKWKEAALRDQIQTLNDDKAKHLGPVDTSKSVSAITGQPQQLSGNKRPWADVSGGKNPKECQLASQASIKISKKEISAEKAAALGDRIRKLHNEKEKQSVSSVNVPAVVPVTESTTSSGVATTSVQATTTQPQPSEISQANSVSVNPMKEELKNLPDIMCDKNQREDGEISEALRSASDPGKLVLDTMDYIPVESNEASASLDPSKEELKKLLDMCENNQLADGEIAAALQSAHDPGKLVLDIMNVPINFMPDGSEDFELNMQKSSCILLLKQLREVSPEINPETRDEAKKFATFWETTLAKSSEKNPLDITCFLQFLASFKLGSVFDSYQLLDLLDSNHWSKEAPDLCDVLGLTDKIPSFIENRINKEQHVEAVKYIYALNMVDKFPPVTVLKDCLRNLAKKAEAQIVDIDTEIKSLEDVVKCITDHKIIGIPLEKLKESIAELERERGQSRPKQQPRNKREQFHM